MSPGRALHIQGVSKRFGAVEVLRSVSAEIGAGPGGAGDFVTLLGPSGCGKTTLLRILAGLETPDAGEVRLGGDDLLALPPDRRPVNMVFQSYALFPHLTVERNVSFGLRSRRVPDAEARRRTGEALDLLRIADLAARKPHQLSGGQRQRVALARALVNEPDVLLLDEPMSALDAKLRAEVQVELRRLRKRLGRSFVLVTHDQDEALTVSDRILVMNAGRIEQQGTPAEVYERPRTRFVATFLGAANVLEARRTGARTVATSVGELCLAEDFPWPAGHVAIRPERVRVVPEPGTNTVARTVDDVIYRGDHRELTAGELRVKLPPGGPLAPGNLVHLSLPPEYLVPLES